MNSDLVPVRLGDCRCPGTPHPDGDFVSLRPVLGLAAGIALQNLIVRANQSSGMDSATMTGLLAEAYLLHGVAEWTLLDGNGQPIPVNPETIRYQLLNDFTRSEAAADKADDLYMGPVLAPLVQRASASLPTTRSKPPTSPTRSGAPRPKPSKRSSTSTSPMDSTEPTSIAPAGVSSS